ncbi:hypothetical protein [Corynebacterium sp. 22KM0430]|uniref:hypothetical protein n=1 Tax=Corynebacterium sp. 22KM0430 TaxID=2989735 RepID=UPI0029CA3158|nr:hypothetical protein [Corynebacterium sp. 22KM0430]WPF65956.1 hypothetical protein OLX12_10440 [Corynebacterium sp. 22KM0430]
MSEETMDDVGERRVLRARARAAIAAGESLGKDIPDYYYEIAELPIPKKKPRRKMSDILFGSRRR